MESTETKTKFYYYHPKAKTNNKGRKVVAGCFIQGKLYLGVAQCFSGYSRRPTPVTGKEWEKPVKADQFNKKIGRTIAEGRAVRGCADCAKNKQRFIIDTPEEILKEGGLGKFFVAEVEKLFKPMVRKTKEKK